MRWKHRFDFVMGAIHKVKAETGERKSHYLNVTALTFDAMMKRADYAHAIGASGIMHDYLTGGLLANTGLLQWCQHKGMLIHIQRAMHALLDRNPHRGIFFDQDRGSMPGAHSDSSFLLGT